MNITRAKNATYWERVVILSNTDNQDEISYIMENECEDDFKYALAMRPDATKEQLAWSADTSSMNAWEKVLEHANVSNETIVAIGIKALTEYRMNIAHASYVHPMQSYHQHMVERTRKIAGMVSLLAQQKNIPWLRTAEAMGIMADDYHRDAKAETDSIACVRVSIDSILDKTKSMDAWLADFKATMGNHSIMKLAMLRVELGSVVSAYAHLVMEQCNEAGKEALADDALKLYSRTGLGIIMPIEKFW